MNPNDQDRRRRKRIATMILCEIRIGELPPQLARVRDLTECGVKIAFAARLLLGDRVRVRLPGSAEWILARVVWCARGVAGLGFVRAIDLPQIAGARHLEEEKPRLGMVRGERTVG